MDLTWIWDSLAAYIASSFYISPFWSWAFTGFLVCVGAFALGWFFSPLRSFAGAIVLAVISGVYMYRRGETDAEDRAKAEAARAARRAKPAPDDQNPWRW